MIGEKDRQGLGLLPG